MISHRIDLAGYWLHTLQQDDESILCRGRAAQGVRRDPPSVLVAMSTCERAAPERMRRLAHELGLRAELESAWAVRPLALAEHEGRAALVLEDPAGEPLSGLLEALTVNRAASATGLAEPAMELGLFLRLAVGLATALGEVHRRGIIHKNVKPAHVFVNVETGQVWLTGFGIASRLPRERQGPEPPETIAGTLAYMAPEQTGRMNRSIDARSDLYSLGVTLYQMLTGSLPFSATDPMEWVHCHVARQPLTPLERVSTLPAPISAIVMKLLAKTAEERYQTAAGLRRDLRRCFLNWEAHRRLDAMSLGEHDIPDRLLIPEKLYGRAHEIDKLLAAFDRIVEGGAPELVLVSGYSGIGKSSVVNELHKVLVAPRGLFAAGKFDQYKRDIPYATLAQAFDGLIRPLLGKGERELACVRDALREALGPNGQLMVDLVPRLRLIVGDQEPAPVLPPQEAQRRFQLVFRRFLAVFARPEHPLALFLDDLQWLDTATLDLLKDLLTQADMRHLLLIGAYRDNEVTSTHPLTRTLAAIRSAGAPVHEIFLGRLDVEDVGRLVSDSLYCERERAASLAKLVLEKTDGNPFFVIQFLTTLVEEGLTQFDHGSGRWLWDLARIRAKCFTDNVVDLMVGKLSRLPANTQKALQQLACLGSSAEHAVLAMVGEDSERELDRALAAALRAGLVLSADGCYRFLHDRVQEAAYSLIPDALRAEAHLRIGRSMAARIPPERREESIFEIVSQLNRGRALIGLRDEREQLAEFNLIAGKRAKGSTAYVAALSYLVAGTALLADEGWEHRPDLTFALELQRAECEFLTGALLAAEARLTMLSSRGETTLDQAAVACLRVDLYTTLDRSDRAVDVGLTFLRQLGVESSLRPTDDDVQREYERTWSLLGGREIAELIDLPLMSDPLALAMLDVLTKVATPALFAGNNLYPLLICRIVNLSIERGNADGSCHAYVHLGAIAGPRYGHYEAGYQFGRLGCDLVEQCGLQRFKARTFMSFGNVVVPWTKHVRAGRDFIRRAFDAANSLGDITFVGYCGINLITNLLAAGDPLVDVQREAERTLAFAQKARFGLVIDCASIQLGLIRTLHGETASFGCFNGAELDEADLERRFSSAPRLLMATRWYWTRKLQARFFAGDYASAIAASLNAQRLLLPSPTFLEHAEAHFYGALSHAAVCDVAFPIEYQGHGQALAAHHRQLVIWAKNCPENFQNRAALVGAEIARVEGRELEAERLYEEAIRSARESGFVHNEALANELAARFYAARGFETISRAYLRHAWHGYLRWGADGKLRQLDELYPQLRSEAAVVAQAGTIRAPLEQLDLDTVIKVSQAISGEMVLEKLLDTLMRTAIEHAGAERAVLILARTTEQRVVAEAATRIDKVVVELLDEPVTASALPETILRYVLHTQESVILDDASLVDPFSSDPYVRERHVRSALCLPLLNRSKLIGVLYLENNLAPRVFVPARAAVLKLVASQAAISLENTRLYRDLARREAKIRRLVDADIIGIFTCELDGRILEANDVFLTMLGYDREDVVAGRLKWTDRTPPEWFERDEARVRQLRADGSLQPFEKEYLRKDGSRVPVLVGVATFEKTGGEAVAYVLDLTERKRAQEALNRAGTELAHVSRVTALSALTASIAHEVNQPLSGIITNAGTCLRMLDATPSNVDGARETVRRLLRDGKRAADVIQRLRDLFGKREFTPEQLDLNEATREVLALVANDLQKYQIVVQLELADDLPSLVGDRVQLQQVVLNLVRNAADAMADVHDRPRHLRVLTELDDEGLLRLAVRDVGIGLPQETLASLFNAFRTTKSSGMGIGLFVSRSIIERHHGRLWAQPNQGPGATFTLALPRDPR